ncbi:VOC family protein [Anaerosporobacter faecicola]|uniref:VOC family protein n=1 Tax=Anaerosporobacter faecicola TaxID=2718714 RepID=UPI00143C1AB1|nr:VOC family protein [Anaerosporobacter faecicola]
MRIEHIAMYVNDLNGTRDFFMKYFGATANEEYQNDSGFRSFFLTFDDGARLEIMTKPQLSESKKAIDQAGFIHIALSVGSIENVDAITTKLGNDGYNIISAPRKTGDGYYESCVLDLEGNQIEITI